MILYNITVILEEDIETEWLDWVKETYLADKLENGIISNRLLKVLDSPNPGVTYCVQFVAEQQQAIVNHLSKSGNGVMGDCPTHFINKFVQFSTVMEFITNQ